MKINNTEELSYFLKHQRTKNKRSQANVSTRIGVQQQTISSFERNSAQARIETLFKIINELGLEFHLTEKSISENSKSDWHEEW